MAFLWTVPLGPVVWLLLGALLFMLLDRRLPVRLRLAGPPWLAGLALAAWLLLRLQPDHAARFWAWRTTLGLDALLGLHLGGWAWLAGFGVLFLAFVAIILPEWRLRPGFIDARLWVLVLAASALSVLLAASWLALLSAWAVMVFAMGLVAAPADQGSARAWSLGMLSTLLLLAAPLFNGAGSLDSPLAGQNLNLQAQLLLAVAALIPLGAYPFHVWLSPGAQRSSGRHLALHLVPAVAAVHLLGRFSLPLLSSQAWALLAIAALLGSALAAWADQDLHRGGRYLLINRATWVLLSLGLMRLSPPASAVLPLVTLILGAALLSLSHGASPLAGARPGRLFAVVLLYGFPFTVAFAPNLALAQVAGSTLGLLAWLLILLAQSLFWAALLRPRPAPAEPAGLAAPSPTRARQLAFGLAVILALWWGVFPRALAGLAGLIPVGPLAGVFVQMREAGVSGWLTIVLPLGAGSLLYAHDRRLFAALRGWQANSARVAGLGWAYGLAGRLSHTLAAALGFLADMVDGAGQFGWVVLAILVAWLLLGG